MKKIDRVMVATVLLGFGVVGDDNPVPPTSPDAGGKRFGPDTWCRQAARVGRLNESNPLRSTSTRWT
jgi:hypothetical protein